MADYGSAELRRTPTLAGGPDRIEVMRADPVIGIVREFFDQLGEDGALTPLPDGDILLAGDPAYRYRRIGADQHCVIYERVPREDTDRG